MSKAEQLIPADYAALLAEVKERVRSAQYAALKAVNKELVALYWDIGRLIEERQRGGTWGKSIVATLAGDLQREFPGTQGFSAQNLWYMRQFYLAYHGHEELQPLVGEISWAKHLAILGKCKDPLERKFYLAYRDDPNVQPLVAQIGWTQNLIKGMLPAPEEIAKLLEAAE